jgi:hypothetical protein
MTSFSNQVFETSVHWLEIKTRDPPGHIHTEHINLKNLSFSFLKNSEFKKFLLVKEQRNEEFPEKKHLP